MWFVDWYRRIGVTINVIVIVLLCSEIVHGIFTVIYRFFLRHGIDILH